MVNERDKLIRMMDEWLPDTDVLVMPTCPIVAPTLAEVAAPEEFARRNAMTLRNTSVWNFFDCCAISLPLPRDGLPVGLMLVARNGHDREIVRHRHRGRAGVRLDRAQERSAACDSGGRRASP